MLVCFAWRDGILKPVTYDLLSDGEKVNFMEKRSIVIGFLELEEVKGRALTSSEYA